jgi:hypothetical protein
MLTWLTSSSRSKKSRTDVGETWDPRKRMLLLAGILRLVLILSGCVYSIFVMRSPRFAVPAAFTCMRSIPRVNVLAYGTDSVLRK